VTKKYDRGLGTQAQLEASLKETLRQWKAMVEREYKLPEPRGYPQRAIQVAILDEPRPNLLTEGSSATHAKVRYLVFEKAEYYLGPEQFTLWIKRGES
jgi:hypothetical protein